MVRAQALILIGDGLSFNIECSALCLVIGPACPNSSHCHSPSASPHPPRAPRPTSALNAAPRDFASLLITPLALSTSESSFSFIVSLVSAIPRGFHHRLT